MLSFGMATPPAWRRVGDQILPVTSLPVDAATGALLPQAHMRDAYRLVVDDPGLDARLAAERIFGRVPRWIGALMAVRNRLVAPFGLKTSVDAAAPRIGFFPIIAATSERVLLGFDDSIWIFAWPWT
jgi:hypothetical protein